MSQQVHKMTHKQGMLHVQKNTTQKIKQVNEH